MWNKAKKLLSLLLALVMVCSLAAVPVSAADERTGSETILVNSYASEDVTYGTEGYFIEIDANDPAVKDLKDNANLSALEAIVKSQKEEYTAIGSDGTEVTLTVTWTADSASANPPFKQGGYINTKGQAQNVWYYFTGTLEPKDKTKEYILDLPTPKAYVRVYPKKPVQTLTPESYTVKAEEVMSWTELNFDKLNLPKTVDIFYVRCDSEPEPEANKLENVTYMRSTDTDYMSSPMDAYKLFPPKELVTYISSERAEVVLREGNGDTDTYTITGWQMEDGQALTLGTLKEEAERLSAGTEVQLELTPTYERGNEPGKVPDWVSEVSKETPVFTLIITKKQTVGNGTVKPPKGITYGDSLGTPEINNCPVDAIYHYVGINGTIYGPSGVNPTNAGDYRVIVTTPEDSDYSGRWASASFTINRKSINIIKEKVDVKNENGEVKESYYLVNGIKPVEKVYDGTTEVKLELETDLTNQFVNNDFFSEKVAVDVVGGFDSSTVSKNSDGKVQDDINVTINSITLTGDNAGNYDLDIPNEAKPVGDKSKTPLKITGGKITPKELTIDTSSFSVIAGSPGGKYGELKLIGVIDDDVAIDMDAVSVKDNVSSDTKEVTLTGVKLKSSKGDAEKQAFINSYTLKDVATEGEKKEEYVINAPKILGNAPDPGKDAPVLGTDFEMYIPPISEYDGNSRYAKVTEKSDKLDDPTEIKYAKRDEKGNYGAASEENPKNAGIYKVTVSFAESTGFAEAKDIEVGTLIIYRSNETQFLEDYAIPIYPGEKKTINLSDILNKIDVTKKSGANIKEPVYIPGGPVLEIGRVEAVKDEDGKKPESFTLKALPVRLEKPDDKKEQTIKLVLESDNYMRMEVNVKVFVTERDLEIGTPPEMKIKSPVDKGTFLKEIITVVNKTGSIKLYDEKIGEILEIDGEFELLTPDPDVECEVGTHTSVWFMFTSKDDRYTIPIKVDARFTVGEGVGNKDTIDLVIYANSTYNTDLDRLRDFVQMKKPKHTIGGTEYPADWKWDGTRAFQPKGLPPHDLETEAWFDWYTFIADLDGSSVKPAANVTVIPVNATPGFDGSDSKVMNAADVMALKSDSEMWSELPATITGAYEPVMEYMYANEEFDGTPGTWNISGWQMDGSDLTLGALKAKANAAASQDVEVMLTPVYKVPNWATVTGAAPRFRLTITSKIPVDVRWDGPADTVITYGDVLNLGTEPEQEEIGDGGTASDGEWDYIYYNANGTRLPGQPTNVGTYQVQAVLISATHSGVSALKKFTIAPRELSGLKIDRADDVELVYNKQPQTPEYIVTDGETKLVKGTDYTVAYTNNISAGTAAVTFTGIGNYTGKIEKSFMIEKLPLTEEQKPVISGTPAVGQVLSASLPGVDAAELEWIWTVDGKPVAGNTSVSYEVKPEDSNKTIVVQAKATDNGNCIGTSGVSESVTVEKFRVTGTVTITAEKTGEGGKIAAGTELTANASVTPPAAETGGAWSWIVDGVEKGDGSTYTVEEGDREIVAVFTPNGNYTGAIESTVIEVGKILLTGDVTIDASAGTDVGSELTANVTTTLSIDEGQFIYTWLRDGEPIPGADDDTYTIAVGDRGKTISVKVTAGGYTGELVSAGEVIPTVEPDAPTVSVTAGDGKLTINWNAPADNGGAPVTGYKLNVTEKDTSDTVLDISLAADIMSYTLEGLTNGKEYSISVSAVNSAGEGAPCIVDGIPKPPESGGKDDNGNDNNDDSVRVRRPASSGGSSDDSDNPTVSSTTTTNPDGSKVTIEIKKDSSVVTTVQGADGRSAVIVTDPSGLTVATVYLPSLVAGRAANGGSIVTLPVQDIYASQNIDRVSTVTVNTSGVNGVKVDIPLVNKGIGVVAVLVNPDGTEKIIKDTIPTQNGIAVRLNNGDTIKILDNSMSFADIGGHWANDAVNFVSARGLFYGTRVNIFSPDAEMTRGMLVTVLARYADIDTEGGATWYEKSVAWAVANGLSDGTNLDGSITREQLAAIMYRYARLQGKLSGTGADLQAYTDADSISGWAADAMSWAVGVGLIQGVTSTTLDPQGSASRAQVAAVFMRYAELFGL